MTAPGRPPSQSRWSRPALVALAFAAAVAGAVWSIQGTATVSCEVCVVYHGREACRSAAAEGREVAVRGATSAACGMVGAGLPERMQCAANPPASVTCRPR